jgi:6-phosphofructokinase
MPGCCAAEWVEVTPEVRENAHLLHLRGGSPIGNSRVKLTNVADCVKRGLVQEGQDPLHVAAEQLTKDGVDVLHTIGGDDTNTTAADLAAYLHENDYELTVVGLPKTIDNDVVPIRQSLGAWTAAEQGSIFAQNIIAEHSSNPRMLIIHEVMGRNCGWLTAETARRYHAWVAEQQFVEGFGNDPRCWDVHAVFVPEEHIDIAAEAERLKAIMDEIGCVNIFLSEGAGVAEIVEELKAAARRCRSTRSATCSSTRSTPVPGSPSSSARSSRPRRPWSRSPATSAARPRPTTKTSPSSRSAPRSPSTRRWPGCRVSSGTTRSRATRCGRSSSPGSRATRSSTSPCRGSVS